jgi:phage shock protein C
MEAAVANRLYRSQNDRVISGVAGGLAEYLDVDPSLVRVGWVLLAIVTGGLAALAYLVMMIVVPLAPGGWQARGPSAGWTGSQAGWGAASGSDRSGAEGSGAEGSGPPPSGEPGSWGSGEAGAQGWPESPPPPPGPGAIPGWQRTHAPTWGTPGPAPDRRAGSGAAALVLGGLLILVGAWFLVRRYVDIDENLVWPIAIIVLGGIFIVGSMWRRQG